MIHLLKMNYRGRHQAQGGDIPGGDKSRKWAQKDPYPADVGHADLTNLEGDIGTDAQVRRQVPFLMAHRFIDNAKVGGGVKPTRKSFPAGRPGENTDVRVDIDIHKGIAFV